MPTAFKQRQRMGEELKANVRTLVRAEYAIMKKGLSPKDEARLKLRLQCFLLRVQGYTAAAIAQKLGVGRVTVHDAVKWCYENVDLAQEMRENGLILSLARLEEMYLILSERRENADPVGIRLSMDIIELEAKILGLFRNIEINTPMVSYFIEGVDMAALK